MLGIAVKRVRHHRRAALRRRKALERLRAVDRLGPVDPEQDTYRRQLGARLAAALDELPLPQRVAFVLCEVEELTSIQAAAIADAPEATIRTRLFHARRRLRDLLGGGAHLMRGQPESFATAVRAFKEMTASADDAAATRARVLAAAGRGARVHGTPRRIAATTAIALLVICSASVAGTTLVQRWRRPAAIAIEETPPSSAAFKSSARAGGRASVVIPPVVPTLDDTPTPGPSDAESDAYGRAHRAHFDEGAPARALAAWDDYLRLYRQGAFEPEARFNRAICLVRLRRFTEAERALRSFAGGHFGNYRRTEVEQLLSWLRARSPARPTAP